MSEPKKRIKSAINILKRLMYLYPDATEMIEEQIASLETYLKG